MGAAFIRVNPVPTISLVDDPFWRIFCLVTLHFSSKHNTFLHLHLDRRGHFNNSSTLNSQLVVFAYILHWGNGVLLWMRCLNDKFLHQKLRAGNESITFLTRKWKDVKLLDKKIWRLVTAHWAVTHRQVVIFSCLIFNTWAYFTFFLHFIVIGSICQPNTWPFANFVILCRIDYQVNWPPYLDSNDRMTLRVLSNWLLSRFSSFSIWFSSSAFHLKKNPFSDRGLNLRTT